MDQMPPFITKKDSTSSSFCEKGALWRLVMHGTGKSNAI